MTHDQKVGLLLWAIIFWPIWSPTLNWIRHKERKAARQAGATRSTARQEGRTRLVSQTGPMWEQDKPFPECFEEDDLDG